MKYALCMYKNDAKSDTGAYSVNPSRSLACKSLIAMSCRLVIIRYVGKRKRISVCNADDDDGRHTNSNCCLRFEKIKK